MPSKNISARTRWGEKPYYSLDYYLKETFGEKIYKIALDAGMTCPNRDGTLDTRGCIFCSGGGSGEFAIRPKSSVTEQIDDAISFLEQQNKKTGNTFIAYFQSFSNTYAPVEQLHSLFFEAIRHPRVRGLSIATRPDCFSPEIFSLLENLQQIKPVWIELGLQSIHEKTAWFIRRGYPLTVFEQCVAQLRRRNIPVITHVILGLPGETREDILQTIHYLNQRDIQGIKLQLLHVLKGTDLAKIYSQFTVYTLEEYLSILGDCICHLSPDIVVHRLTGDGPKDLLIAPVWSRNKRNVLNQISHYFKENHIYQGKNYADRNIKTI